MTPFYGTAEDVNDSLEGAVIQRLEDGQGGEGFHLILKDGRTLLLLDCSAVVICVSRNFLQ